MSVRTIPKLGSNTWALYERGWSGITIDPLPGASDKFKQQRPRDIFLNIALGEADGEISFFLFPGYNGDSTCDRA